jgi:hypothetical protein
MKKRLNVDQIQSELRGGSAFFPGYKGGSDSPAPASSEPVFTPPIPAKEEPQQDNEPISPSASPAPSPTAPVKKAAQPLEHNIPHTSKLASKQDSKLASNHASMLALLPDVLEAIRKIVKNPGKEEVLYVRLSKEEKDRLADISYTYKRQGIRTSDNEVVRVAINALLEDYKTNRENSLLAIILASLHA